MTLAWEEDKSCGDPLGSHRVKHGLRLVGRDHTVLSPLQQQEIATDLVNKVDWRTRLVELEMRVDARVSWTDQLSEVVTLKLVSIGQQQSEVTDSYEAQGEKAQNREGGREGEEAAEVRQQRRKGGRP
jgi:hypothetical protein